jgi:hypothetical protein
MAYVANKPYATVIAAGIQDTPWGKHLFRTLVFKLASTKLPALLNQPPKRCYAQSCRSIYPVTNHEGFSIKLSRGHKTGRDLQSGQAG